MMERVRALWTWCLYNRVLIAPCVCLVGLGALAVFLPIVAAGLCFVFLAGVIWILSNMTWH